MVVQIPLTNPHFSGNRSELNLCQSLRIEKLKGGIQNNLFRFIHTIQI